MRFRRRPWDVEWKTTHGDKGWLADAGILIHCFDGYENQFRMWESSGDQSNSIIYHEQGFPGADRIPLYKYDSGGIIWKPGVTLLNCGKGGDSGGHCGNQWCPSVSDVGNVGAYSYPGDGCGASWRVRDFGVYLQRQSQWQEYRKRLEYNEIIVDGDYATAHLPHTIDAMFTCRGGCTVDVAGTHRRFLSVHGLTNNDVPLVEFDPMNWMRPFSAVYQRRMT